MRNEIGKWYWVTGRGPMKLVETELGPQETTVRMNTHDGVSYWAPAEHLRLLTPAMLDTFEQDSKARGYDVSYLPEVRARIGQ